jgi:hypothetical protein
MLFFWQFVFSHTYALAWFAQFEIQTQKIEKLEFGQIGKLAKFIEI